MAYQRGRAEVSRFVGQIPQQVIRVLRGAAKAGATVVADEAKATVISEDVREAIKVATRREDLRVIAKVQVQWTQKLNIPIWLEYGTERHFISVDDSQRQGMSVGRINKLHREGSLVINGKFVGTTVYHPGATPHPFLRPSLDRKEADAVAAAQSYVNARWSPAGLESEPDQKDDG